MFICITHTKKLQGATGPEQSCFAPVLHATDTWTFAMGWQEAGKSDGEWQDGSVTEALCHEWKGRFIRWLWDQFLHMIESLKCSKRQKADLDRIKHSSEGRRRLKSLDKVEVARLRWFVHMLMKNGGYIGERLWKIHGQSKLDIVGENEEDGL